MASIDDSVDTAVKSKRPADSAFKQQRLAAWQPILTAGTVLPTFFVIGVAFIPVGVALLNFSSGVKEHMIDYTECKQYFKENKTFGPEKCSDMIAKNPDETCECRLNFTLNNQFEGKVYMYYGLSNFYQNHRRYVKSRDDNQLLGILEMPSKDCSPFDYVNDTSNKKPVAPCGAIANSLFSDTLTLYSYTHTAEVPLLRKGIAWPSDKKIKFRNPSDPQGLKHAFRDYAKPSKWKKNVWELDPQDADNNGFQNEDLIVWMRTAALPGFRKLYRLVNHSAQGYADGLPRGDYSLIVDYSYQVNSFNGTKYMILSTTSLLGGKNPFLGIAYIVVGSVCLLLGIVFFFIHIKCGKSIMLLTLYYEKKSSINFRNIYSWIVRKDRNERGAGILQWKAYAQARKSYAPSLEKRKEEDENTENICHWAMVVTNIQHIICHIQVYIVKAASQTELQNYIARISFM